MRNLRPLVLALFVMGFVAACGDDGDAGDDGAATTAEVESDGDDGGGDEDDGAGGEPESGDDEVTVTLTGGDDAGEYGHEGINARCSRGLAGEGAFGVQFSDEALNVEGVFSSLQVIIPDPGAAASGTDDFTVLITIGPLFGDPPGTSYDLTSGTATLEESGDGATLTVEGETDDGVTAEVTVRCSSIIGA